MSAVSAVKSPGFHVLLSAVVGIEHASVLPRVLDGIEEDNVIAGDVQAAEDLVGMSNVHLRDAEDASTVVNPVI